MTWQQPTREFPAGHGAMVGGAARAASPRTRRLPTLLVVGLAAVGAGLLGLMGQATGAHAFRGSWELSRLGGPWLLAAFVGGALGGWGRRWAGLALGLLTGAVMVGAGSVVYYGLAWYAGTSSVHRAAVMGIGWGAAGVAIGGVVGLLGAASTTDLARRHPSDGGRPQASWLHGAAFGTLGGLLIGEAIALLWVWDGAALRTMAMLEGLGGAALVMAGAAFRGWRFFASALASTVVAASLAPAATIAVRDALRSVGWGGA